MLEGVVVFVVVKQVHSFLSRGTAEVDLKPPRQSHKDVFCMESSDFKEVFEAALYMKLP